ncbi:MAG TPA: DUF3014 domain-containing protein [Usitatibacter sp.]|nr:DUF3014 domain-containing protein [Usitatibacter sp.]
MRAAIAILLVLVALGAGGWFWWQSREPPPPPPVSAPAIPTIAQPKGPRHPVPAPPADAPPLPALKESDPLAVERLSGLFGPAAVAQWFIPENLVRNIVATIDNLPRESVAARVNPVKPLGGAFVTSGKAEALAIDRRNFERYRVPVALVERLDARKAVDGYLALYPLFQQAYVELGYPGGHFNDRVVEVIDHLLEAPEPAGPIALAQPKVLYEYADPGLESRSAGQKVLIRMGPENAGRVKAKLREIRAALLAGR